MRYLGLDGPRHRYRCDACDAQAATRTYVEPDAIGHSCADTLAARLAAASIGAADVQPGDGLGVGDFIHAMIRRWFLADYAAGCQCADMVARMNRHGPDWCRANLDAIAEGMVAEAARRGWRLARWRRPAATVARGMIRRACRLAEAAAR